MGLVSHPQVAMVDLLVATVVVVNMVLVAVIRPRIAFQVDHHPRQVAMVEVEAMVASPRVAATIKV